MVNRGDGLRGMVMAIGGTANLHVEVLLRLMHSFGILGNSLRILLSDVHPHKKVLPTLNSSSKVLSFEP
jgi:hypothetical protein